MKNEITTIKTEEGKVLVRMRGGRAEKTIADKRKYNRKKKHKKVEEINEP